MEYPIKKVPGNVLEVLFKLQKEIVEKYIRIEGLPQYPIELETKAGQKVIKDFFGRIIEELSESYESLLKVFQAISNNEQGEAIKHLQDFNEEMADAWHFWLETLLFSGIDEDSMGDHVQKLLRGMKIAYIGDRPLSNLYKACDFLNEDLTKMVKQGAHFRVVSIDDATKNPYIAGGRVISERLLEKHVEFLWGITHELKMTANLLKQRDWVESGRELNTMVYHEKLINTFLIWVQYNHFCEIKEISLYHSYTRKNQINQDRIKNKY